MFKNSKNHINHNLKLSWLKNLSRLHHDSQKGQILPAMAVGILFASATALTLSNAKNEQQNVIAQQGAIQAQNITEAGIAKSLTTFSQGNNPYLLFASYDDKNGWTAPTADDLDVDGDGSHSDDINIANGCGEVNGTTQLTSDAEDVISQLVNNNSVISDIENAVIGSGSSTGTYVVKGYDHEKVNGQGQGRLTIQGQSSLNTQNKAQYEVTFSVNTSTTTSSTTTPGNAAALMGEHMNTRGMAIFANTAICTEGVNCGNDVTINSSYCADGFLDVDTSKNYSALIGDEKAEYDLLQEMMGSDINGFVRAPDNKKVTDIILVSSPIPPTPVAPDGANILNVDVGTGDVTVTTPPTTTGSITTTNKAAFIDLSQAPFSSSFVEEDVDGDLYHAIYIQVNNVSGRAGDINVVINETALENITVNGNKINTEKMIVRLYIGESMTFTGNDAIQVYDASNNRITGATEKERKQIASLRIIGGNADGTAVGNLSWDMNGTGCLMGHVHAPTTTLSLPQGNGCGNSGGERPIALNTVAQSEYGTGNFNSIGNSVATPNVFGAIWAKSITNSSNGASGSFYENPELTKKLTKEFGSQYPSVTGAAASSTSVPKVTSITSIVRLPAEQ